MNPAIALPILLGWHALTGVAGLGTSDAVAPPSIDIDAALDAEQSRIETIARVAPAVVCIYDRQLRGGGSGVIIDSAGYGLTNFHVVADMFERGTGLGGLADGNLYDLQVLGIDPTGDVAMFRLTGKDRFDFAELGDSDAVRVGDFILAMGNPFILAQDHRPTVTMGMVTGTHRYQWGRGNTLVYSDCIQTDAAINPGNSGGPLFDLEGRVIGINGRISVASGLRGQYNVGLAYAISANQIKRFIPALRAGHLARHGTLQATVNRDLIFNELLEEGPAWKVGIRPGDRLLRFGGRRITSDNQFASLLGTYPEGWPVPVSFERRGQVHQAVARLDPLTIKQDVPFAVDPGIDRPVDRWVLEHFFSTMVDDLFRNDGWARAIGSSPRTSPTPTHGDFDGAIQTATARTVKLYGLGAGLQPGYGSGIIVSPDGQVLTVLSILVDSRNLRAVTPNGTVYAASVVHRDADRQLALLQLKRRGTPDQAVSALPAFANGSSVHLRPGDWVIAAGNPFKVADGAEPVSVALGIFSGRTSLDARRRMQDHSFHDEVLAIDAVTANPGAPGGPLVDLDGRWVGLVGRVVVSNLTNTQFNHALPVELCFEFLREARDPTFRRAAQQQQGRDRHQPVDPGIKLFEMGYRKKLVYVEKVRPSSPADRAGLESDDLIVGANGRNVPDVAAFRRVLDQLQPGEALELTVIRNDELRKVSIILDPSPADPDGYGLSRRLATPVGTGGHGSQVQRANQDLFRTAAGAVAPCVVRIETVGGAQPAYGTIARSQRSPFRDDPGSDFRLADGPTTGLVYSSDGYVLTSSFNFVRQPHVITVTLPDGRPFVAGLVARDQVRKLALLKIDTGNLPVPAWADRDAIHVGQWALALGRAFGGQRPFVTVGIISALDRMHGNALQTDTKLSPANYGGPLIDLHGRVLGICVPMAQRPGELAGVELYDAGVGFALPQWRISEIVAELRKGRSFYRGWLGMAVDPFFPDRVQIAAVADPSPLRSAGAETGDVIRAVNGREVHHFGHLMQALYMLPAGETVQLRLSRGDDEFDVEVTLVRSADLGPLPELRPPFDPSAPTPQPDDDR